MQDILNHSFSDLDHSSDEHEEYSNQIVIDVNEGASDEVLIKR